MLTRSLVALLLSIPAVCGAIGLVLALAPADPALILPALLLTFPLWVVVATASYVSPVASRAALVLGIVSGVSFALIALLRVFGVSSL